MGFKARVAKENSFLGEYALQLGAELSAMFGKPCLKHDGKAFAAEHLGEFVCKLSGPEHERALALSGAHLWDPSGKGRPMKAWVAVPVAHKKHWGSLASTALSAAIKSR